MKLKDAVSVVLISLFSASVVVLLDRWIDGGGDDRIESRLTAMSEQLQAMRRQAPNESPAAMSSSATPTETAAENLPVKTAAAAMDGSLVVYSFHGNVRSPTDRAIESQVRAVVEAAFADELQSGAITWQAMNYEADAAAELCNEFDIQMPVIVLAVVKDGQVDRWERLDRLWPLATDKAAFADYVRVELEQILSPHAGPFLPPLDEPAFPEFWGE